MNATSKFRHHNNQYKHLYSFRDLLKITFNIYVHYTFNKILVFLTELSIKLDEVK